MKPSGDCRPYRTPGEKFCLRGRADDQAMRREILEDDFRRDLTDSAGRTFRTVDSVDADRKEPG